MCYTAPVKDVAPRSVHMIPCRRASLVTALWSSVLLLAACAAPPRPGPVPREILAEDPYNAQYKVKCDDVSGKTVCIMTGNALRPFMPRYPLLALGIISEDPGNGETRYFLRVLYVNEGEWLGLETGESLQLLLDEDPVALAGDGSSGERYTGEDGKVYEVALYRVPGDLLRRIASTDKVKVEVKGDFAIAKHFGPINKLYFKQFVGKFLDAAPAVQPSGTP